MPLAKSGRRGSSRGRWRRCAAGSRKGPSGSRTGPTSRPSRPGLRRRRDGRGGAAPSTPSCSRGSRRRASAPRPRPRAAELLRRLSFDLTGLPPTPEEVRAFAADQASRRLRAAGRPAARLAALRRADGRLLARPRALRRQRRLPQRQRAADVALPRLGDRTPSTATCPSTASPPSSSPATCCPNATLEQKIASGYNRLLQTTEEGGAQPKEYRAIYLADRVRNVSTRLAGRQPSAARSATITSSIPTCARDFYRLGAFFADVKEAPVGRRSPTSCRTPRRRPRSTRSTRRSSRLREALEAAIRRARPRRGRRGRRATARLALHHPGAGGHVGLRARHAGHDPGQRLLDHRLHLPRAEAPARHLHRPLQDRAHGDHRAPPRGPDLRGAAQGRAGPRSRRRLRGLRDRGARTRAGADPLRNASASTVDGGGFSAAARSTADAPRAAGRSPRPTARATDWWWSWREPAGHRRGDDVRPLVAPPERGRACAPWAASGSRHDRAPCPCAPRPASEPGRGAVTAGGVAPRGARTQGAGGRDRALLPPRGARARRGARAAARGASSRSRPSSNAVPASFVHRRRRSPSPVRILPRGNWLDESGEVVAARRAAVPAARSTTGRPARHPARPRALADVAPENPLTARVLVNRLWKLFFGQGLSRTRRGPRLAGRVADATRSCSTGSRSSSSRAAGT